MTVQRTDHGKLLPVNDMGIDHGCVDMGMPQQGSGEHYSYLATDGCKTLPRGHGRIASPDVRGSCSLLDGLLESTLMNMPADTEAGGLVVKK